MNYTWKILSIKANDQGLITQAQYHARVAEDDAAVETEGTWFFKGQRLVVPFTKVTEDEMTEFAERFLPLLNPKLIKMITDENGELLAFIIAMADLSEAIKNSRGRILPFGWARIFWAMKTRKIPSTKLRCF